MRKLRAVATIGAVLFTGAASAQEGHSGHPTPGPAHAQPASPEAQRFAREMDAGMARMMADMHSPGYTGNPDVDFLAMMIPHHAGAVEMARLVLANGRDPVTRRLAEDIIASQTAEIESMQRRLAILRRSKDANPDGYPALDGTRGGASK